MVICVSVPRVQRRDLRDARAGSALSRAGTGRAGDRTSGLRHYKYWQVLEAPAPGWPGWRWTAVIPGGRQS